MTDGTQQGLADVMSREVAQFVATAAQRGKSDLYTNRRAALRFHRAVPLLVARLDGKLSERRDYSVTMADVSSDGIGFYCDTGFPVGSILGVRLFRNESGAVRVPVVVCHNLVSSRGVLVGCRFAADEPEACELVEQWQPAWYE